MVLVCVLTSEGKDIMFVFYLFGSFISVADNDLGVGFFHVYADLCGTEIGIRG